jgi:hypothetical protein
LKVKIEINSKRMCFDTEWLAQVLGAGNGEEVGSCDYFWFVPVWWVGVGGWTVSGWWFASILN